MQISKNDHRDFWISSEISYDRPGKREEKLFIKIEGESIGHTSQKVRHTSFKRVVERLFFNQSQKIVWAVDEMMIKLLQDLGCFMKICMDGFILIDTIPEKI